MQTKWHATANWKRIILQERATPSLEKSKTKQRHEQDSFKPLRSAQCLLSKRSLASRLLAETATRTFRKGRGATHGHVRCKTTFVRLVRRLANLRIHTHTQIFIAEHAHTQAQPQATSPRPRDNAILGSIRGREARNIAVQRLENTSAQDLGADQTQPKRVARSFTHLVSQVCAEKTITRERMCTTRRLRKAARLQPESQPW